MLCGHRLRVELQHSILLIILEIVRRKENSKENADGILIHLIKIKEYIGFKLDFFSSYLEHNICTDGCLVRHVGYSPWVHLYFQNMSIHFIVCFVYAKLLKS